MNTQSCEPAVWLPTIRAGTGADVFAMRLCDGLNAKGIRAEIGWLPHRAEYMPWAAQLLEPPVWANVVHVNSWLPTRFWPKGLPVVVTVHHLVHDPAYHPFRSPLQAVYHELLIRPRERHAIRDAHAVTAVSEYVKRTVSEFSGREQITVIHNWIDGDAFASRTDSNVNYSRPFRLFMAGSHSRRKGIDLLPAFLQALGPGFEVRYAGGKSRAAAPTANIVELGKISESELIREYQGCDAVVSLSRYEGFGYTALEAMACGKSFLGFNTSALPEVVAGCGLLVSTGDVHALARVARELRERASTDKPEGAIGRERALRYFSAANLDKYVVLYSSLIEKNHAIRSA